MRPSSDNDRAAESPATSTAKRPSAMAHGAPRGSGAGRRREAQYRLLADAGRVLLSTFDPRLLLERVAQLVVPRLADWCVIDLVEKNGELRRVAVAHADPSKQELARQLRQRRRIDPEAEPFVARVLRTREPELYPEVPEALLLTAARDSEHLEALRSLGIRSGMLVPLVARGRVLGVMSLISAESGRPYAPCDLALAEELAQRVALSLDHARLYRKAQEVVRHHEQALDQLQSIYHVSDALARAEALDQVYRVALDGLQRTLRADRAAVLLADPDGVVRFKAWRGLSETYREAVTGHTPWPPGSPAAPGAIEPLLVPNVEQAPELEPFRATMRAEGIRAVGFIPLMHHGRVIGKLMIYYDQPHPFTPEEVRLARTIASHIAFAIERQRLQEALQQRAEALEHADRAKDEFLAMLAHELRNPLGPIRNAVQLLLTWSPEEPRLRRALEVIDRQVRHQARLLDDLLNITCVARGKILLRPELLDLVQLVRVTAEDHRAAIEQAWLHLTLHLPEAPVWVTGDATRLTQVFGNLLHNARKFTEPGGEIAVELTTDPEMRRAVVRVRDTGIGISPEMLPRIFEPFSQVETGLARSQGGLGLGLALVKGLVELHGGEVRAFSAGPGHGTEFEVLLPLAAAGARSVAGAEPSRGTAPRRILLIEDNRDAAETMRDLLELAGHVVEVARSGREGLEAARRFQPEVVLCDIGLPEMDGYEVARALRAEPGTASALLIAVSGYGQAKDLDRSRAAGFDHHLVKPVDLERLKALIEEAPSGTGGEPSRTGR